MTGRLLSFVLILSLGLSSLGFGMALGRAPAVGEMVICTGYGAVTVSFDADGNPVESHGLCPDAALAFWAEPPAPPATAAPADLALVWGDRLQDVAIAPARVPHGRGARAPPA
ncbi:hypothetical protein [Tropicimonas aquimaris]|uniref:DUF2946 domain-containing protein n=1 Tax=Tropicimonas aquimaris TaxID=914152 RepID=A0ABW3ILQ6_9RHOB